jgi:phosphoribosylformylglycinamidine synthase
MELKSPGSRISLIETEKPDDPRSLAATHRALAQWIAAGKIAACHDLSDGGLAVAAAEMCIASGLGLTAAETLLSESAFSESAGRYLVELSPGVQTADLAPDLPSTARASDFALVRQSRKFSVAAPQQRALEIGLEELTCAWRGTLDW